MLGKVAFADILRVKTIAQSEPFLVGVNRDNFTKKEFLGHLVGVTI